MITKICTEPGCISYIKARGLCNKHYLYLYRRNGLITPTRTDEAVAFLEMCVSSNTDECLIPSFKPGSRYPTVNLDGKDKKMGNLVLIRTVGPKKNPTHVMRHLCGKTRCCNPRHLKWGTEIENAADRKVHGTEPDKRGKKNPNYRHGRNVKS